jgi:hypothetical protein
MTSFAVRREAVRVLDAQIQTLEEITKHSSLSRTIKSAISNGE